MKKLIFRKFAKDTSIFIIMLCLVVGLIVWTMQAVNYFDFVTQDGHGLKTYFSYLPTASRLLSVISCFFNSAPIVLSVVASKILGPVLN